MEEKKSKHSSFFRLHVVLFFIHSIRVTVFFVSCGLCDWALTLHISFRVLVTIACFLFDPRPDRPISYVMAWSPVNECEVTTKKRSEKIIKGNKNTPW